MAIAFTLTVEEPDTILVSGNYGAGAVIRLQWSATEAGAYANVSGTGSTPTIAIVAGTRSYPGRDPAGTESTWYRTRIESADTLIASPWTDPFQPAPEGTGLICSLADVKQELGATAADPANDETLIERIRQIGDEIHQITGRLFLRTPSSGTDTFLFDVAYGSRELRVPKGVASATLLEVATSSQPESGGTYSTVTAAEWFLRPTEPDRDYGWPATSIVISDISGSYFASGYNTVRLTGALGWATVPHGVQAIALRGVVASYLSKGTGAGGVAAVGPTGAMTVLRYISPADKESLMRYANIHVA